jgi:hypothetical protein
MSQALRHGVDGFPWLHASAHADFAGLHESASYRRLIGQP